ncbi:hypothetical protein LR48_Vigan53s000700 [Vigna angularis]|uniref:Uncharacterized protein n=1 Tax=Phaseolus angularis TaxID=3914 RepID=A0A0L9T3N9_PHAAN|nr:hypothetical protein LR48_Vigan53s000700 [Vigna angularis]
MQIIQDSPQKEVCKKKGTTVISLFGLMRKGCFIIGKKGDIQQIEVHKRSSKGGARIEFWVHIVAEAARRAGLQMEAIVELAIWETRTTSTRLGPASMGFTLPVVDSRPAAWFWKGKQHTAHTWHVQDVTACTIQVFTRSQPMGASSTVQAHSSRPNSNSSHLESFSFWRQ